MKKNFRLVLALVLAAMMIVGSFSAIAAVDDLAIDSPISITGLDKGDIVNLYQVLAWSDGFGWAIKSDFADLVDTTNTNYSANVAALVANTKGIQLTAEDVAKIAKVAQGKTATNAPAAALTGTTFTYDTSAAPGMYLGLVTAATPGTVYNPIIVSSDFTADNGTDTIPATSEINGTAITKKKPITLEKTEPIVDLNVGEVYHFTIATTIPVYSAAWSDTWFTLTDNLSDGLTLDASTVKINDQTVENFVKSFKSDAAANTDYVYTTNDQSILFKLNHSVMTQINQATDITVTYDAELTTALADLTNVAIEDNQVKVEFPNNPNDLTGKKVTALYDETREYTFTIDGKLLGNSSWETGELVKIGVDENGDPIESVINLDNGSSHAALEGAVFAVYSSVPAATDYESLAAAQNSAKLYTNDVFDGIVTTDEQGLMTIPGLDAGDVGEGQTYYFREISAPKGYIKDQTTHHFTIAATYTSVQKTKYYTVNDSTGEVTWSDTQTTGSIPYTYTVDHVLQSYTVTVDDQKVSTFTMNNQGPHTSSVSPAESSTDIANTKGVELPSTGGIGTTIFYIGGSILVLAAAILLITKRRMGAED